VEGQALARLIHLHAVTEHHVKAPPILGSIWREPRCVTAHLDPPLSPCAGARQLPLDDLAVQELDDRLEGCACACAVRHGLLRQCTLRQAHLQETFAVIKHPLGSPARSRSWGSAPPMAHPPAAAAGAQPE
jgi:hypothetical protein